MKTEMDTLEKIGKVSYQTPEGYFDDLRSRLDAIPAGKAMPAGPWMRVRPYLAMAASFAAILLIGNAVLRNTAMKSLPAEQAFSEATYAEMVSLTNPDAFYQAMEYEQEDLSDEDIINYLIESGAKVELIAYAGNQ